MDNCSTATIHITIEQRKIVANADTHTHTYAGTESFSLIANDTINGTPVSMENTHPQAVTITLT